MKSTQMLKSISVFVPLGAVVKGILKTGFLLVAENTIVTNGKFWTRFVYTKGEETVYVSEEIGDVYPKDPIITIFGSEKTITRVLDGVSE